MKREDVYKIIDGEREYQDSVWNCQTTDSCGIHSVAEWLVYINDYTLEAMHICARNQDPYARNLAMESIRKIAAMCVSAMEQIDTKPRVQMETIRIEGEDVPVDMIVRVSKVSTHFYDRKYAAFFIYIEKKDKSWLEVPMVYEINEYKKCNKKRNKILKACKHLL